jgi:hypothetical protein
VGSTAESVVELLFMPYIDGLLVLFTAPEWTGAAEGILEEPEDGA